jgi:hypothetical protein
MALGYQHARATAAARPFFDISRLAVQGHREGSGQRCLANMPGAGKQISVTDTIMYNRPTKQIHRPFMSNDSIPCSTHMNYCTINNPITQLPLGVFHLC